MVHEGLDSSRESVALFGIYDALSWRREMEISMGPNYRRLGQRIIVYPKFLDMLGMVSATENVGLDMEGNRDIVYENILEQRATWQPHVCPILIRTDNPHLSSWPALLEHCNEWMEDAKRVAVAGYRQVLEDGPETCNSESDAEYSDHGEKWTYEEMYTPETLGPDGKPRPELAHLSTAQANALRPSARLPASQTASLSEFTRTLTRTARR
jgi:hypothetical protein